MRLHVVGAGAMGTLFGTQMVKTGHDVTFFDGWQTLIDAMKKEPIARLHLDDKVENVPVHIEALAEATAEPADFLILFVKSTFTEPTMKLAKERGLIGENTVILTCQGGFENPELIASFMPNPSLLIPGCTTSFCKPKGFMQICNFGINKTTVWPFKLPPSGTPDPRVVRAVEECAKGGLKIELTPLAIADRWKMLLYYPTNIAVSAATSVSFGKTWEIAEGRSFLEKLADECALVAEKEGIDTTLFNAEIAKKAVADLAIECPVHGGSMLADMKAKRPTEIDATAGALIRRGISHGLVLPFTEAIWSILRIREQSYGSEI